LYAFERDVHDDVAVYRVLARLVVGRVKPQVELCGHLDELVPVGLALLPPVSGRREEGLHLFAHEEPLCRHVAEVTLSVFKTVELLRKLDELLPPHEGTDHQVVAPVHELVDLPRVQFGSGQQGPQGPVEKARLPLTEIAEDPERR